MGVVQRKNTTVKKMGRTILNESNLPDVYWKEVVHKTVYTLDKVQIRVNRKMTPYELWYDKKILVK